MGALQRISMRIARWSGRMSWRAAVWAAVAVGLVLAGVVGVRVFDAVTGPPLAPWHTLVPDEMSAREIDAASLDDWLEAEDRVFSAVSAMVATEVTDEFRSPASRYEPGGTIGPRGSEDWNRTQLLVPDGPPRGAVVLLHGLTDAPYSLRHVAWHYRDRGFVALAMRMPGHGTVPGGLIGVDRDDWAAATRLAVREAVARAGADRPLHIVGYSNGGALALKYALDALDDPAQRRADRLVLMSPMVGVTEFARFAGIAGWPAVIPSFVRAAWFSTLPEFNPFKYNSFPVNAAVQAQRLTVDVRDRLAARQRAGGLADLPPILTFQSAVDSTVSPRAVIATLYDRLPANGSELVLYDLNRTAYLGPLIRPAADAGAVALLPPPPRSYAVTVVTGAADTAVARRMAAGETTMVETDLKVPFPRELFSLGHVALPFPASDGLYGALPDPADDVGIRLGAVSTRGEFGVLLVGLDTFSRVTWNPFFDALLAKLDEVIADAR
jgi:alpha-beta hydrolase superfamily lysophospholipase